MGLFLTMLACKINSREKVLDSIIKIMKRRDFIIYSKKNVKEITGKENQFEISDIKNGWVQVFCPEVPNDSLASSLSKELNVPVFQFHIHNGEFWMYQLFLSGKLKDKFNPLPDYWSKLNEKKKNEWKGKPALLAKIFNISEPKLMPYLIHWEKLKDKRKKAFPDDEFPLISEWSIVDFQKKLGIIYPEFDKPDSLDIIRLTFKKLK